LYQMAQLFNRLGSLGLGIALAGGIASSALYNGTPDFFVEVPEDFSTISSKTHCCLQLKLLFNIIYSIAVDGGHRAVIYDRFQGVRNYVVGEGTHFIIPWVQKPIIYDVRSRPRNIPVITGSKGS
jgi:prohibitin 1